LFKKILFQEPDYSNPDIHLSDDVIYLIKSLLQKDPKKRPTIKDIKKNPWLASSPYLTEKFDYNEINN